MSQIDSKQQATQIWSQITERSNAEGLNRRVADPDPGVMVDPDPGILDESGSVFQEKIGSDLNIQIQNLFKIVLSCNILN